MEKRKLPTPSVCPVCGEDVPAKALACPECGADHQSGWRENAGSIDATGALEDDFDYEEFAAREFGSSIKPAGISPLWWITAVVLLLAFAIFYVAAWR